MGLGHKVESDSAAILGFVLAILYDEQARVLLSAPAGKRYIMVSALGAAGVGAAGVGAADLAASRALGRLAAQVTEQVERDSLALRNTGRLPAIPCPVDLRTRRRRSLVGSLALGIIGTGFVFWLLGLLAGYGMLAAQWGSVDATNRTLGPWFVAGLAGFLGWGVGVVVGSLLYFKSGVNVVLEGALEAYARPWWRDREAARVALENRQADPRAVEQHLATYWRQSQTLTGRDRVRFLGAASSTD